MRKYIFSLITVLSLISACAEASSGGSVELINGRLKIQLSVQKNQSKGSFQLRSILEKSGFTSEDGFVSTGDALAPLEIYNYLYESGTYVFTIFLPVNEQKFFVSLDERGFISFSGLAAQKLFEVVKLHVARNDVNNLEQYKWADSAYCDRTKSGPVEYRCWIDR